MVGCDRLRTLREKKSFHRATSRSEPFCCAATSRALRTATRSPQWRGEKMAGALERPLVGSIAAPKYGGQGPCLCSGLNKNLLDAGMRRWRGLTGAVATAFGLGIVVR